MANAGYGNHDEAAPGSGVPRPKEEGRVPAPKPSGGPDAGEGERKEQTPGEGATKGPPQGDEADPGVG